MIDKIQFLGVLLWMIGMLVMAAFAVREVWFDVEKSADEAGAEGQPGDGLAAEDEVSGRSRGGQGAVLGK